MTTFDSIFLVFYNGHLSLFNFLIFNCTQKKILNLVIVSIDSINLENKNGP